MFLQQTDGGDVRIVTSASDLTAASNCEFAFLRRADVKFGRDIFVPADDDEMLSRAAGLGDQHEERTLEGYRARGSVAEIERPESMREAALFARERETTAALESRADIVFQATFFDPAQRPAGAGSPGEPAIGFVGFADFLQHVGSGVWEVQDTKLARRAKVSALMQLAAYAGELERLGFEASPEATLILGDGNESRHRIADIAPVFRARRDRLHRMLLERYAAVGADGRRESAAPVAWGAPDVTACGRCEVCEPEIVSHRDPLLISGMQRMHRDRFMAAGVTTIDGVAALSLSSSEIDGISGRVLERLVRQAQVQVGAVPGEAPPVQVAYPHALAAIPQPSEGDLFFDFEGDPMYREPGLGGRADWGLDYLFGMVDVREQFTALWAHDLAAEKQALIDFMALVAARRAEYPGMHIYHYAAYERTHLTSIAARHGVCEAEVDDLLREHVLVDLYPVVRGALRVGSRSYSIKKLEPLYMGDELRDETGVTNGAQSVTEYAEASEQLRSPLASERALGQQRLDAIGDYNRYDCVSTLRLRDWLLGIGAAHGVSPYDPADVEPEPATGPELTVSDTAERLMALAEASTAADEHADAQALRLAASAIDYHDREQKSFWWSHFARLVDPVEDWADTRDVVVVDPERSVVLEDWHRPPRARTDRRILRLRGTVAPGSSLKGGQVYLAYAWPAPFRTFGAAPGARGTRMATVIERLEDGVIVQESLGNLDEFSELPMAVTPGPPPRAGSQATAIEKWGRGIALAREQGLPVQNAVFALLRRDEPSIAGGLVPVGAGDGGAIDAVVQSLAKLESSALAVQGPPGTGKTYLASRVIKRLVEERKWRIGVVAQSHKVVDNVLGAVARAGLDASQVGKVPQGGKLEEGAEMPDYTVLAKDTHLAFARAHTERHQGFVIGGTAWDFSSEKRFDRDSLDLLVIDEAGQFSLAPTIAASVAADRLLLLGDPQQLPQVSQGTHPEPVDESALGWLIGEHDTLPSSLGYFLADTRRMRPELADIVSELSYEGRLHAHPSASERVGIDAGLAGLTWHPVRHTGNATHSVEEATAVASLATRLLSGRLIEDGGVGVGAGTGAGDVAADGREFTQADIIVVAPYNAQVECVRSVLDRAGLTDVRVGTVDKFQGQEAAIAIVTLAASSPEDVPRGLEFLLMRNRLNVAISRAQWGAHLVSSDRLGGGMPGTVDGLRALSGYLRLLERAHTA